LGDLAKFILKLLAIKKGVIRSTGMLNNINKVWKGANKDTDAVPAENPNIVVMILPAHVGHPIKRPQVVPTLPNKCDFFSSFNFLKVKIFKEALNPTNMDTIKANNILIGINKIKKCVVK
jgi:hypothetical protein